MDFKGWMLEEGWSIDLANIPFEELQAQLAGKSSDAVHWLRDNAQFNYYGKKDALNDFIKVVPFNRSVEVPSIQLKKYIPSFEGVRIYYGYTFAKNDNYQDKYSVYNKRANPTQVVATEIKEMEDMIRDLQRDAAEDGSDYEFPPTDKIPRSAAQDIQNLANQAVERIVKMNSLTYHSMNRQGSNWGQYYKYLEDKYGHPFTFDYNIWFNYYYLTALKNKQTQLQSQFTTKEDSAKYVNVIKIAFSKMLKEPETPAGIKNRDNFIKQAADNFHRRMNKRYNMVVYPESSKEFNKIFAEYLGKLYGVPAQQGFRKLPAGQVTLDKPAIQAHYGPQAKDVMDKLNYGYSKGFGGHYAGITTSNPDKPLQVKNFNQDYRRYIKMWEPTTNYAGKNILIVDDNVDKGGTLERIYDLAIQQKPKSIDIYTPLYIGGGHGITHS